MRGRLRLLLRHQLRYLARTPAATAAQVLGTALGVTSVVAVHLVSERIKADLEANVPPSGYTHIVRGEQLTEDAYFDARTRWRSGAADRVEAMGGHTVCWASTCWRTGGRAGPAPPARSPRMWSC